MIKNRSGLRRYFGGAWLLALLLVQGAWAADLTVGAVSAMIKVRPGDAPVLAPTVALKAAQNEFEAFQIVIRAGVSEIHGVTAKVSRALTGPGGAKIPAGNIVFYVERTYTVGVPSNDEGAAGPWPDPLIPDVDTYFGEKRNAFPLDVPAGQARGIWIDLLVPLTQTPGDYVGEIEIDVAGVKHTALPVSLHVGTFALPSTASLATAFGMDWNMPALAHCPGTAFPFCSGADETTALRALYIRSALEHRFTISATDFQPPTSPNIYQTTYEKYILPLVNGTDSQVRLPGAKLTAITHSSPDAATLAPWINYAQLKGFSDRLLYYPYTDDEPGTSPAAWAAIGTHADALHAVDSAAQMLVTASIQEATGAGASSKVDVFVPLLNELEDRPGSGGYAGNQRPAYDAWLAANPSRKIWSYQSCMSHGCGVCGEPSVGVDDTGWPNRVIDSSGVQDRAFPWQAWRFKVTGELYFDTTFQLATAWNDQCEASGSGDGTIFYPGTVDRIGGTRGIPIESIRMKLIREGMEDYEYLVLVAAKNSDLADSVANGLFSHSYDSAKSPEQLESARDALFAVLDSPVSSLERSRPKNLHVR